MLKEWTCHWSPHGGARSSGSCSGTRFTVDWNGHRANALQIYGVWHHLLWFAIHLKWCVVHWEQEHRVVCLRDLVRTLIQAMFQAVRAVARAAVFIAAAWVECSESLRQNVSRSCCALCARWAR